MAAALNTFGIFGFLKRQHAEKDSVGSKNASVLSLIGVGINIALLVHYGSNCFRTYLNGGPFDAYTVHFGIAWWLIFGMAVLDAVKVLLHAIVPVPDAAVDDLLTRSGRAAPQFGGIPMRTPHISA